MTNEQCGAFIWAIGMVSQSWAGLIVIAVGVLVYFTPDKK